MSQSAQTPFSTFTPSTEFPGWHEWSLVDERRFNNAVLGRLLVRGDTDSSATVRMFPQMRHTNMLEAVHGGATLGFIDVALFGAARQFGLKEFAAAVTLDLSVQFIGAGKADEPLDARTELLKETGRFLFMQGRIEQGDHLVASFQGTVRKASPRVSQLMAEKLK